MAGISGGRVRVGRRLRPGRILRCPPRHLFMDPPNLAAFDRPGRCSSLTIVSIDARLLSQYGRVRDDRKLQRGGRVRGTRAGRSGTVEIVTSCEIDRSPIELRRRVGIGRTVTSRRARHVGMIKRSRSTATARIRRAARPHSFHLDQVGACARRRVRCTRTRLAPLAAAVETLSDARLRRPEHTVDRVHPGRSRSQAARVTRDATAPDSCTSYAVPSLG